MFNSEHLSRSWVISIRAHICPSDCDRRDVNVKMNTSVHGIHHVTAIAGDPQENLDFYMGVLGMHLVKKSVNQDAPDTYHLFYADGAGTPGTDLTFFPWPQMEPARAGAGFTVEVALAVPRDSLT